MIPFSRPSITELEQKYVSDAMKGRIAGDNTYTDKVCKMFGDKFGIVII